ncbi:MAG TPA: sugar phosphate isomerase/epimerase [Terrimicrobiaceae bacterium]
MTKKAKIALNPLPWVLTERGFELSVTILRQAFSEIAQTPFKAIHADPPAGVTPAQYRALLAEYGLVPAPGYYSASFEEVPASQLVESARRHAAIQAELGNTEVFIAGSVGGIRMTKPAIGASADRAVLAKVIDGLGTSAAAITAEGVRPMLHPHVGTAIEVEDEIHTVLAGIEESVLGFGPDTGHLTWAGVDAAKMMRQYAHRIGAMHLKDVHADQVSAAKAAGASYEEATRKKFTVWTEPGRGDIDLIEALAALPESFSGWIVIEVDVPEAPTNLASTEISAAWITEHLGSGAFTANQ